MACNSSNCQSNCYKNDDERRRLPPPTDRNSGNTTSNGQQNLCIKCKAKPPISSASAAGGGDDARFCAECFRNFFMGRPRISLSADIQYVDARWEIPVVLPLRDCTAQELKLLCCIDGALVSFVLLKLILPSTCFFDKYKIKGFGVEEENPSRECTIVRTAGKLTPFHFNRIPEINDCDVPLATRRRQKRYNIKPMESMSSESFCPICNSHLNNSDLLSLSSPESSQSFKVWCRLLFKLLFSDTPQGPLINLTFLFVLTPTFGCPVGFLSKSQLVTSQFNDKATVSVINEEIEVPGWGDNGTNFCNWRGITCNLNHLLVERLALPRLDLRGNVTLISELKALKQLDLSGNNFHGPIPSGFGNLSQLEFLDLSSKKFEGLIPRELGSLRSLKSLNLSNNLLVGEIPDELQGLERLEEFQISSNNFNGSIPSWVGNLTSLRVFTAYENELGGEIPDNLGSVSELKLLNLHSNQLKGPIPSNIFVMGKLEVLVLTQNRLSGGLPELVGNCQGLSNIRIGNNDLEGVIPKAIGNELILSGNNLFGDIPKPILGCKSLNKLDLSNNRLNGTIPNEICNMSRLQYLLLSQNSIKGEIPHEIGNCLKLLELQMGSNYLTGSIPPEIGRIRNLQIALNLSYNHLHGSLPPELGKLDKLVSLDVSSNQLSGTIPQSFKGMLSLIEVNFSNNLLSGPIPTFAPFQKSPNSSFLENKGLCGEPLSFSCGNAYASGHANYHHKVSYRIILAVIGSGLAVFVSVTVVVLLFMMRERQEKDAKTAGVADDVANDRPTILAGHVFVENLRQAIDLDAVLKQLSRIRIS
ncbi:hypothetical protein GH714_035998 [Hevea brasiliensis]|uniref:Disease resistance R13L4/SHOC-2-like LRR domain-containing protein n=1 Tax=Hevea brasiliensis TaxID=3981 RepID=A0A6A6KKD3_HEVBR|nr:hypothetical protein GH714_035998 [Hevea brasiliensis]